MASVPGPGGGGGRIGSDGRTTKSSSGMARASIQTGGGGKAGRVSSGSGIDRMAKGQNRMPTNLGGFTQHPQTMFTGRNPRSVGR